MLKSPSELKGCSLSFIARTKQPTSPFKGRLGNNTVVLNNVLRMRQILCAFVVVVYTEVVGLRTPPQNLKTPKGHVLNDKFIATGAA